MPIVVLNVQKIGRAMVISAVLLVTSVENITKKAISIINKPILVILKEIKYSVIAVANCVLVKQMQY